MQKEILLLVDYKNQFGSKFNAEPYRSGMDIEKIIFHFNSYGYTVNLLSFNQIDFNKSYRNNLILYSSSEDPGLYYKNYIEDIILALEMDGARVIPAFKYLRSHNNKVFMELLRSKINDEKIKSITSYHFGSLEEFLNCANQFDNKFPLVIKSADGSMSRGVKLVNNLKEGEKSVQKISRTRSLFDDIWDIGRLFKHKGYKRNSIHRKKFVVQNFISDLKNDWKILIFGDKYYVLKRLNRENDFRASGGGRLLYTKEIPEGMLDFAKSIFEKLDLPHVSMDIAYDGKSYHLFEFQSIYFGTYTLDFSDFYFTKSNDVWTVVDKKSDLEKIYVESIIQYLTQINAQIS